MKYDAIVVGARCGGSPTAMLLARRGYRVLLVDRAELPSDILSTHFIHQPGVRHLKRWGLLDQVRATGCPPVRRLLLDFGPVQLRGTPPPDGDAEEAFAPRRYLLDQILCEGARNAGAEVRLGFRVEELLFQGDRVAGIRGRRRGGSPVSETARIVIGADGRFSKVAQAVGAPKYLEKPVLNCSYYSYWSGLGLEDFEYRQLPGKAVIVIPTNDGQTCIWIGWKPSEFEKVRADVEGHFQKALGQVPDLAQKVSRGRQESPFAGTAGLPNYLRRPFGDGWALVGDAGYLKDPATGQGISDAFRDAELLAEALHEAFSGQCLPMETLARYEKRRNRAAIPIYRMVCRYATLDPPPPPVMWFLSALRGNQKQIDRLAGTVAGTVSNRDFFSPANIARVVAGRALGWLRPSGHSPVAESREPPT